MGHAGRMFRLVDEIKGDIEMNVDRETRDAVNNVILDYIRTKASMEKHCYGKVWYKAMVKDIADALGLTKRQVQYALAQMRVAGRIEATKDLNAHWSQQDKWYAINEEK